MMSQENLCRLCAEICQDYKSLYDESGNANEVQQLMIQYFDENLLHMATGNTFTVMCMKCWYTISDFNCFQQSIYRTQRILHMKNEEIDVKSEEEFLPEDHIAISNCKQTTDWNILVGEDATLPRCDKETMYDSSADDISNTDDDPVGVFTGVEFCNESNSSELLVRKESITECNEASKIKNILTKSIPQKKRQRKNLSISVKASDGLIAQWIPVWKCIFCTEKCSTFSLLQRHFQDKHPLLKCQVKCCSTNYSMRCRFEDHIRLHVNPDVFKCKLCEVRYSRRDRLKSHMRKHHTTSIKENENTRKIRNEKSDDLVAKWLPSIECAVRKEAFETLTELEHHFQECHPSEEFYVECCQRMLMTRLKIVSHVRYHVTPSDFKCDLCCIWYSHKMKLQHHRSIVH